MKPFRVGAALTILAAVAAATAPGAGQPALAVRQNGLIDVINAAQAGLQGLLGGKGDDDDDDDDSAKKPKDTPAADPLPSPTPTGNNRPTTTTTSKKTTSPPPSSPTSSSSSSTTKQSAPSPTGAPCSSNGAKQCAATGTGYQLCQGGRWIDQSCSGTNVCGKDENGGVACMSPEQANAPRDPCSKKDEQRCHATDPARYQTCDGKLWQSFSCGAGGQCKMAGGKATCAGPGSNNSAGAGDIPYTLHSPVAYRPVSEGAPSLKAAFGTLAAALVLALALTSASA